MGSQPFTSSGTFTPGAGVTSITVACWGGGGGGGAGTASFGAGAGGGGAYSIKVLSVTPGVGLTVTVGGGGAGGATIGASGAAGGDTWLGTSGTVFAQGGSAGTASTGGAGGSSGSGIGDTVFSGAAGAGGGLFASGSGGGSSAGTASNGVAGAAATAPSFGAGGTAPAGGGDGGNGGTPASSGVAGSFPGGGGGGGGLSPGPVGAGGAGAGGEVVVTWADVPMPVMLNRVLHVEQATEVRRPIQFFRPQLATAIVLPTFPRMLVVRVDQATEDRRPLAWLSPQLALAYVQPVFRLSGLGITVTRVDQAAEDRRAIAWLSPQLAVPYVLVTVFRLPGPGVRVVSRRYETDLLAAPPVFPVKIGARLIDYGRRYASVRGLYRVFNAAVFRFYRSNVAPPLETDSPFATSATLPSQPATTYADGTWYISASYFNGVLDSGFLPLGPHGETYQILEIAGGVQVSARPSGPTSARLQVRAGGVLRVIAYYLRFADGANAADVWSIGYTTNGSTPANNAPNATQEMSTGTFIILTYDLPAQATGTTVKVQLQTLRTSGGAFSLPGTVLVAVADATGPTAPLTLADWVGPLPEDL